VPVPHRSDARRNRAAILRAAGQVLLTDGPGAPSPERIARLAGVGQATVYRHFPDRRALALAVAEERLSALSRFVAEAGAFRPALRAVLLVQASARPLVGLLRGLPRAEQRRQLDRVTAVLSPSLCRARDAGQLRADVGPADLELVFAMVEAAVESTPGRADATQRAIDVLLDGLCRP
jgi:AcrR family transcriptional regulator